MNASLAKTLFRVTVFSIAMGYLESSVAVYLRALYYPEGFAFPLKVIAPGIAMVEIFRELATMLMLIALAVMAGRTKTEKFAWFIYSFAIWDIFYYVFLKIILNWPQSLFTWDLLFMLPSMWVGPVIAPVINAFTMIVLALAILVTASSNSKTHISACEWCLLCLGSLIVICAYTMDYAGFIAGRFSLAQLCIPETFSAVLEYSASYIPKSFSWPVFLAGVAAHGAAIALFYFRESKNTKLSEI